MVNERRQPGDETAGELTRFDGGDSGFPVFAVADGESGNFVARDE
jgi:hypothetical protein